MNQTTTAKKCECTIRTKKAKFVKTKSGKIKTLRFSYLQIGKDFGVGQNF